MYQRQYKAISDDNIMEEMVRQFDFIREDFKELFLKQRKILEINCDIMEHLNMNK